MKAMLNRPRSVALVCAAAIFFAAVFVQAQQITITPLNPTGVYATSQTIRWTLHVKGPGADAVKQADYVLKQGELTVIKKGSVDLSSGQGDIETKLDQPGTVLAVITAKTAGKPIKVLAGAAVDPEKIQPSAPPPDDFDAFWTAKLQELSAIPVNVQIDPADGGDPSVDYFKIRMDNLHGSHIYGQIARPKKDGKFPALLMVQWAGVYGLPKSNVVTHARQGWLTLDIMAHDLPFDQPADFYKKASETTLKNYVSIGDDDRDKSYFLRMYLACYRAADYLAHRPDWNGKTLVVMGTSQGGQQSIVTAGIYPGFTAMLADVPGGCDVMGEKVGRPEGFPYWANEARWTHNPKILETGRYFDSVNFASRIKCPALVATGLIDETCPAAGVFAAFNQIKGPKRVLVMVNSNHHGTGNAQAIYFKTASQWLAALAKGEEPPMK